MRKQCVPGPLLSFVGPGNEARITQTWLLIATLVCMIGDYQENHNTDKLVGRVSINVMYMYILANLNLYFCRILTKYAGHTVMAIASYTSAKKPTKLTCSALTVNKYRTCI